MRSLILACFLALLSCAHTATKPVAIGHEGPLLRQCELPVKVSFSTNMPPRIRTVAIDGFKYWNTVAGAELFTEGPDLDDAGDRLPLTSRGVAQVAMARIGSLGDSGVLGVTFFAPAPDGCIIIARVEYNPVYFDKLPEAQALSIIRHEAGHVLGIGHSPEEGSLMFWADDMENDPKEAGPWEKLELLGRYDLPHLREL